MFKKLNELVATHTSYMDKITDTFQRVLRESYQLFLQSHPEVDSLRFRVYIPTFNDGAPCVITFSGLEVLLIEDLADYHSVKNKEEVFEEELNEYWNNSRSLKKYLADYDQLQLDLQELEEGLLLIEPLLEKMYGVNVRVVINRVKIETEAYEEW